MQIWQDLYMVGSGGAGLSHVTDANVYVLDGGTSLVMIDAGSGLAPQTILDNILRDGLDPSRVDLIVNTHSHWDHARGNAALKDLLGCKVAAHYEAVPQLEGNVWTDHLSGRNGYPGRPSTVDHRLEGGERLEVGRHQLDVLATPGHSADSLCFAAELAGRRFLFSGDTLSGEGSLGVTCGSEGYEPFRQSLELMRRQRPDALMPGHRLFTLAHATIYIDDAIDRLESTMADYSPGIVEYYPSWWLTTQPDLVRHETFGVVAGGWIQDHEPGSGGTA